MRCEVVYGVRTCGQWLQCWRAAVRPTCHRLPPLYFCNNVCMHLLKLCLPCVNCQLEVRHTFTRRMSHRAPLLLSSSPPLLLSSSPPLLLSSSLSASSFQHLACDLCVWRQPLCSLCCAFTLLAPCQFIHFYFMNRLFQLKNEPVMHHVSRS